MLDWLRRAMRRESKAAPQNIIAWHALGRPAWSSRDYGAFAREGYGRNAVAYRCVRLIAEAGASIVLKITPADHPLAALLTAPNPEQTGPELFEAFFGHLQVAGNAFLEAASLAGGPPRELYALRPDRMAVIPGPRGWPLGWEMRVGAQVTRFERDPFTDQSPILHLKLFAPADEGNVLRATLSSGQIDSVSSAAVLDGANVFAVENPDGAWEILQARDANLVGAGQYEFSGLMRGQQGTEGAMGAAAGARIALLDTRLVRLDMRPNELGAEIQFAAVATGRLPSDPAATLEEAGWRPVWGLPFSPVEIRAARGGSGDVALTWIRRTREGGDIWDNGDVPLGEDSEAYLVEIVAAGAVIRAWTVTSPAATYAAADQVADFGAPPASLTVRIAQISARFGVGTRRESTIAV